MRSEFEELKRFAIADILSVSGRQKTTETVDMHINTIIDIAFLKGQQESQSKIDELQKQRDSFIKAYEIEVDESVELQKRVDASLIAFEKLKDEINELHGQCDLHLIKYLEEKAQVLEQALKGEQP